MLFFKYYHLLQKTKDQILSKEKWNESKSQKKKGIKFGRPKVVTPPNTNDILDRYINHEITNTEAASLIGVSRGTFFRLVKERKT